MKRNNWLVPGLIVSGVLLILLSVWLPQNKLSLNFSRRPIGTLLEKSGSLLLRNNEMPAETEILKHDKLHSGDTLRTAEDSESLIEFHAGGQILVQAKTEILLELLEKEQILVVIRTGNISVEKLSDTPLWIRKDGQQFTAADYALLDKNNRKADFIRPDLFEAADLLQPEIEQTLNQKKGDFFKCFGQLLQRYPQASGQVMISFSVIPLGSVTEPEIAKSDISDAAFQACLLEVVARTRFRSFKGSPVTTVFPIKFE